MKRVEYYFTWGGLLPLVCSCQLWMVTRLSLVRRYKGLFAVPYIVIRGRRLIKASWEAYMYPYQSVMGYTGPYIVIQGS